MGTKNSYTISTGVLLGVLLILQGLGTAPLSQVFAQEENVSVTAITWSSDGQYLALGDYGGNIKIIDASTHTTLKTWRGHLEAIFTLAWSPDNTKLISGSQSYAATVWDVNTSQALMTMDDFTGAVSSVGWLNNDRVIIHAYGGQPNFRVWELSTASLVFSTNLPSGNDLSLSPDGQELALGYGMPTIDICSASSFQHLRYIGNPPAVSGANTAGDEVFELAWHPEGSLMVTGANSYQVSVWDTVSGVQIRTVAATDLPPANFIDDFQLARVKDVWFSPDGSTFSSVAGDGTYRTWETATGQLIQDTQLGYMVTAANVSPDRQRLALGKADGTVQIIDVARDE